MSLDATMSQDELVELARREGLNAIDVVVIQLPNEDNGHSAVVLATARTADGGFSAVGEASPLTATPEWGGFMVTLAEMRAKARAVRELVGRGLLVHHEGHTPYGAGSAGTNGAMTRQSGTIVGHPDAADASPSAVADLNNSPNQNGLEAHEGNRNVQASSLAQPSDVRSRDTDSSQGQTVAEPDIKHATSGSDHESEALTRTGDDPDFDAIDRDMEAKLLKFAISIAELEGDELSESEARSKLDGFFVRAFKHPLARASRIEGQRVVQRLSADLARLRSAAADKD